MRLARFAIAPLAVPLLLMVHAQAAAAAPPGNDVLTGATPVTLGFSGELDTTEATTDVDDAQLDATCGVPATDASVWYAFTPEVDADVVVDVSQSTYSPSVLVGVGTQGALETVACGPHTVTFPATAGTTYYLLAVDDQLDGGGNGGTLRISVGEPPPPATLDVVTDPVARFDGRTGAATFTGTYTCSNVDSFNALGQVEQGDRPSSSFGWFRFSGAGTCDGTTRSWSAVAVPDVGSFVGGKVATLTFAFGCGDLECASDTESRTIMLRGGSG